MAGDDNSETRSYLESIAQKDQRVRFPCLLIGALSRENVGEMIEARVHRVYCGS